MKFVKKNILKTNRNGVLVSNSSTSISTIKAGGSSTLKGDYLPATPNGDGTYTVNLAKVHFNGNVIANGEVTAYKKGTDGEISGGDKVVVYDGLDSSDSTIALSANQGRILKELVDTKGEGIGKLEDYYTKLETDKKIADLVNGAPETMDTLKELSDALLTNKDAVDVLNKAITNKAEKKHTHTKADITDLDLTKYDNHLLDNTKHVTEAERTKWDNKLDQAVWDKAFYFNGDDLRVKLNLIGDKEVSAYGKGETGSGVFTIADNLNTEASDVALSARQGVILKDLIDSKTVDVDLSDYYTKSQIDINFQPKGNYLTSIPSEYVTESELNAKNLASTGWVNTNFQPKGNYLTSHQSLANYYTKSQVDTALDGKSNTGHTHSQYLTQHQSLSDYYTKSEVNSHCWTVDDFSSTSNWDTAYNLSHTHNNKSVLDGISSTDVTSWNNKLDKSVWDKAFYFDGDNVRVKLNLIGDKEVSAYGKGNSSSSGAVTIVDSLNSYATDAALSANQGRVLKDLIDSTSGGSSYTLPAATSGRLGGVKIGNGIDVSSDGTISVSGGTISGNYLPITGGTVTGVLRLQKPGTYVSPKLNFGDREECYILEEPDTTLTIHSSGTLKLDSTNVFSANGYKVPNKDDNYVLLAGGGTKAVSSLGGGSSDGNYYISKIEGDGNSTVTYYRNGFTPITHNMSHTHSEYLTENDMATINNTYLTRGGNIQLKTVNGESIMGSGNISVSGGSMSNYYTKNDCDGNFYDRRKGVVLNTRTIYGSASLNVNDDFIIVNNSSWANITLPSSAPVGKIIHFKQLTGAGLKFVGGVFDATGNTANWNFELKKYAHSFYLIHTGGNKWAFFGGW